MAIQGARPNSRQVVPYLMVRDGSAALDFYQKAFGAKVIYQAPTDRAITSVMSSCCSPPVNCWTAVTTACSRDWTGRWQ